MILVVDDEDIYLFAVKHALEQDGHQVETFNDPKRALEHMETTRPELVISDVRMPDLDGFGFKKALAERFPRLDVPFVFLSSLAETDHIVRGLNADADDYLTKPVDPRLLRAKIRTLLARRSQRGVKKTYRGDLHLIPFVKIVQFCESNGFSGEVDFFAENLEVTIPFRGGDLLLDEIEEADALLESLYDLDSGSFSIRTATIAFDELPGVVAFSSADAYDGREKKPEEPMGRLSAITLNDRDFQVQTEMVHHPEVSVLTVVVLDGNTLLKRVRGVPHTSGRRELEQLIGEQHEAVEDEVRHKVQDLLAEKAKECSFDKDRFFKLFDTGFEKFREGRIADALADWEEAKSLNPEDTTLDINIKVAREKLEAGR